MKKIAIAGVGGIGGNMGGYMAKGGQDVTLICTSWHENAEAIKQNGLTLVRPNGEKSTVRPKCLFVDELPQLKEKIEILVVAVKSNDTAKTLDLLKPYLAEDVWVVSPQNGINEDVIIPIVGKANTVPCVSWMGGGFTMPGVVWMHDGYYVIGELDGQITPRIKKLARILSLVVPAKISTNIMQERWNKLSQVSMTITVGSLTGLGLGGVFANDKVHPLLARIMCENMRVASAAGCGLDTVLGIKAEDWKRLMKGRIPEISKILALESNKFSPSFVQVRNDFISGVVKRGSPLDEIDFTNGCIIKKGKELGVPTPVNEIIVSKIKSLASGKLKASLENIDELKELTEPFIR